MSKDENSVAQKLRIMFAPQSQSTFVTQCNISI